MFRKLSKMVKVVKLQKLKSSILTVLIGTKATTDLLRKVRKKEMETCM